jgi:hypothetical protein
MIIMNDHASLKQKKITTRFFYPESHLTGRHNNMYYILFLTLLGNILFQDGCRAREKTTLLFQKSVCISACCDNCCWNFRF